MLEKELFFKIFNNNVLKSLVLSSVKNIHIYLKLQQYSWDQVLSQPLILTYHNYIEELAKVPIDEIQSFKLYNQDILYYAVQYGKFDIIKYLLTTSPLSDIEWSYINALGKTTYINDIDIFKYLLQIIKSKPLKHKEIYHHTIKNAASKFRLDIIEAILELFQIDRNDFIDLIIQGAIQGKCLDVVKHYLSAEENGSQFKPSFSIANYCGFGNNLDILDYLYKKGFPMNPTQVGVQYMIKTGNLDLVKWFHTHFNDLVMNGEYLIDTAAEKGHLGIVRWLHENRIGGCTTRAMDRAVHYGRLETMKWLHFNRTEGCTTEAMDHAAEIGDLETIKWLHENRTEGCTTEAIDMASYYGHMETVRWLYENRTEMYTLNALFRTTLNSEITTWLATLPHTAALQLAEEQPQAEEEDEFGFGPQEVEPFEDFND